MITKVKSHKQWKIEGKGYGKYTFFVNSAPWWSSLERPAKSGRVPDSDIFRWSADRLTTVGFPTMAPFGGRQTDSGIVVTWSAVSLCIETSSSISGTPLSCCVSTNPCVDDESGYSIVGVHMYVERPTNEKRALVRPTNEKRALRVIVTWSSEKFPSMHRHWMSHTLQLRI